VVGIQRGPLINRTFSTNIIIGISIALFAYFLKQSALPELALATCSRVSARLCLAMVKNRSSLAPSWLGLGSDAACVVIASCVWTYAGSLRRKLFWTLALALILLPVSIAVYRLQHLVLTSPLIALGILAAIALESCSEYMSRQIHTRLLDEKQEGEFSILGHLNHNVKPNLQIAKSPIVAVHHFLQQRGISEAVLAKKLDGSDETVGEALHKAVLSLNQIAGILDNTKKLVT